MLPRYHRLTKSADLKRIRQNGQSWRHPLAVLLVHENGLAVSRFGFVAGRHVGNAVERNRSKRLMREAIRTRLNKIRTGQDCLFLARHGMPQASLVEVEKAIAWLLTRSDLLTELEVRQSQ